MGNLVFTNNASGELAAGIGPSDTSITLGSGEGANFPTPTGGQYAKCTLEDVLGNIEIVHLASRSGDVLTVARAQEGTIGLSFPSGSRFELRLTAAAVAELLQRTADTMSGAYDCTGGVFTGGRWTGGEIVATPLRGAPGGASNEIVVPSGGAQPTIGTRAILDVASSLPAANLTGTIADARIGASSVTQHQAALTIAESQITAGALLARLASANVFNAGQSVPMNALAYAATLTPDCNLSNSFRTVLTGPATLAAPSNPRSGMVITFVFRQDATGSRVLTWNSIYKHAGGVDPVLSIGASAVDVFSFIYDDVSAAWLAAGSNLS